MMAPSRQHLVDQSLTDNKTPIQAGAKQQHKPYAAKSDITCFAALTTSQHLEIQSITDKPNSGMIRN